MLSTEGGRITGPAPRRGNVGHLLRVPTASQLIAADLRGQLARGELIAGDSLPPERELVEQFGVSREGVREALRVLEAESLLNVRHSPRGGATVLVPNVRTAAGYVGVLLQTSRTTVNDVYDAKSVIEPAALGILARTRSQQDLEDLNSCIVELDAMDGRKGDDCGMVTQMIAAQRFVDLALERSGNVTLALQAAMLTIVMATHLSTTRPRSSERNELRILIASYRTLMSFLDSRDSEGAQRHWRAHLDEQRILVLGEAPAGESVVDLVD
jgi:GntR family transcriptional repressor for pyruvate dehydrogenase complex